VAHSKWQLLQPLVVCDVIIYELVVLSQVFCWVLVATNILFLVDESVPVLVSENLIATKRSFLQTDLVLVLTTSHFGLVLLLIICGLQVTLLLSGIS
jgi:hypothetical protein